MKKILLIIVLTIITLKCYNQTVLRTENFDSGGASWHSLLPIGVLYWTVKPSYNGFNFDGTPILSIYCEPSLGQASVQNITPIDAVSNFNLGQGVFLAFDYRFISESNTYGFVEISNQTIISDTVWFTSTDTIGRDTVDITQFSDSPLHVWFTFGCGNGVNDSANFNIDNVVVFTKELVTEVDENVNLKELIIYPNPIFSKINIEFKEIVKSPNVIVFNNLGQVVFSRDFNSSNKIDFDIDIPKGIFFLKIESEGKIFTEKIIKQ